ncbi:MAG TPA: outer membrane beta-barrel protein [Thermoanaerobaculia bacterium]|nr:outer membrane beta-barrel protein [Thermoanaerobaculia bacterium]
MNMLRRLLFLAVIATALAGAAYGDVLDFRIRLNNHIGMPAARVLVTFELSGAPAGSTLSIEGGPASGLPAVMLDGGDQTTAVIPAGANQVRIEFLANSQFNAGSYCTLKGGATGSKDVDMTLTTPAGVAVNAYRVNTYMVASTLDCGTPRRRLAANEATITKPDNTPLTIDDKGRHPVDVILVLDESGSMSLLPPGAVGGDTRWQILEKAVTAFVNRWEVIDAPVGAKEWSEDRIGVVFFTTNATNHSFGGSFFKTRGAAAPGPGHNWQDVIGALAGHGPSNLTALGKGINNALDQWIPIAPPNPKNDASFVIFTDGIQNVDPQITTLAATTIQQLVPTGGGAPVELYKHAIPIHSIAFGMPDSPQVTLLDRVSQQTAGAPMQTADAFPTFNDFANALVAILKGGTISLAHRSQDTLTGTVGPLVPVEVDGSVRRAVFSVEWLGGRGNRLDLQVFPPGATPGPTDPGLTPTQRADDPTASVVQGFDIPGAGPAGVWQVRVARRGDVASVLPPVEYNLSSHLHEGRLSYQISFDEMDRGTGDPLGVRAEIAYDGVPLDALPPNAVRVRIARPDETLGNILHKRVIDIPGPSGSDPTTPYDRKVAALAGEVLDQVTPKDVNTITLTHAGNGVYTGSFSDTSVAGQYHFDAILDWNDPRTARIHRVERIERALKVNADPASTEIDVTAVAPPGSFVVRVTPRDRFGNYAGPGYGDRFVATAANGTIAGPPVDTNQTGDYVFRIDNVPPGENPKIDFTFDNRPVGSTTGGGGTSGGQWRVFVDAGFNSPDSSAVDGKFSVNAGIERMFTSNWSAEAIVGYHSFDAAFVDPDIWQLSANVKYFFGTGAMRPFMNGGVGVYRVDPPDDTEFGMNAGGGLLYQLNPKLGVEGVFNYHTTDSVDWSTFQIGLRWGL